MKNEELRMEGIDMNRISMFWVRLLTVVIVIAGLAYAGRVDYNEEVLCVMSQEAYELISGELGTKNENRVVDEYQKDPEGWEWKARWEND